MVKSNLDNIQEYFDEISSEYPDIDYKEFEKICRGPFKFTKEVMSSGKLKNIRLQYFGVFEVSKGRINYIKDQLEVNLKEGKISKEKYDKKMTILNSYENN